MSDINNCTRCGNEFGDFRLATTMTIVTERRQGSTAWDNLPNMNTESKEILCEDCFRKFTGLMAQMNIKKDERYPELN